MARVIEESPALDWVTQAWEGRTASEKLVLMRFALVAEGDGPWTVKIPRSDIAGWADLSVRNVDHSLTNLVADGVIKVEKVPEGERAGGWYRYTFG